MRRALALLPVVLSVAGCRCAPAAEASLLSEAKRALAERDRRLTSYHLAVNSAEGEARARHEFFFRAPNKLRGVLVTPQPLTLAFDGARFFRAAPLVKKLEVYDFELPPDKAAHFLATTFHPFVPEGYRAPLLPRAGVTVARVAHPRAPDAVEVTAHTEDEAGQRVTVTWTLRLPAGDFLGKTSAAGGVASALSVDDEACDGAARLCVPKKLTQRRGDEVVGVTEVTLVELNVELPNDGFTLAAPEGWAVEPHRLVESD